MGKAKMGKNPAKRPPGANTSRPTGASAMAESFYPPDLIEACLAGNRATRRLARRNLRRRARKAVKFTP